MKAIIVEKASDTPKLRWEATEDPVCGPEEVIIDVRATAVNRADLAQAAGIYPPPEGESEILGLEAAGDIAEIGSNVTDRNVGDPVFALLQGGGYAEKVAVPHQLLMPIPEGWSYDIAAAVPEVWLTAFSNLFQEGGLSPGNVALIHAGASGVGTSCLQLCKESGITAIATAGSPEKLERCRQLGASLAINYKTDDFAEVIATSDFPKLDMILDPVGGPYLKQNIRLLKPHGRLINIGIMGGRFGELDMAAVLMKRLRIKGSRLRSRTLDERTGITKAFEKRFLPLLASGALEPIIDRVMPVEAAEEAHAVVRRNENLGKVILKVRD